MAKHIINGDCPKCKEILMSTLCHPTLREWFVDLQAQRPEVHIAYAYRGKKEQDAMQRDGKSNAKFGKSPHNYIPVMALDIFFLVDGKYYLDLKWLENIANTAPSNIAWGGVWKMVDGPHFEIKNWKSLVKNYPNGNKDE